MFRQANHCGGIVTTMHNRQHTYIANWKMYWNTTETITFVTNNLENLCSLADHEQISIVLCPSFIALDPLAQKLHNTRIELGAQDCSNQNNGAYTGQISATDLKDLCCTYCIIGHSERRRYNGETDAVVAEKCQRLVEAGITPIVCVGETKEENQQGQTLAILEKQLTHLFEQLAKVKIPTKILIAYEPIWAIGTGLIPTIEQLEITFTRLSELTKQASLLVNWKLIYGGSISSRNIQGLKGIVLIDGFLIGGASLDFQEFEKIVKC